MTLEQIAQVCHEVNRAFCIATHDHSQPTWDEAPEWQKESAIKGVKFHIATPDADASASHNSWMQQKLNDGWVYGEIKDPEAKTHIVEFEELPMEQQAKDYLFKQVVHSLMKYYFEPN